MISMILTSGLTATRVFGTRKVFFHRIPIILTRPVLELVSERICVWSLATPKALVLCQLYQPGTGYSYWDNQRRWSGSPSNDYCFRETTNGGLVYKNWSTWRCTSSSWGFRNQIFQWCSRNQVAPSLWQVLRRSANSIWSIATPPSPPPQFPLYPWVYSVLW